MSEITQPPANPLVPRPRPRLKQLAQRAVRAANQASELLPGAIEQIGNRIKSGEMSEKGLLGAASFLERVSQQRALVAQAAGLKSKDGGATAPQTVFNVTIRSDMPLEERLRLIREEVSGVKQVEAVVVTTPVTSPSPALPGPTGRPEVLDLSGAALTPPDAAEVPSRPVSVVSRRVPTLGGEEDDS